MDEKNYKYHCKYLDVQDEYISMKDDLYTPPIISYYCNEQKKYITGEGCPLDICKYKAYADCGGHYEPDDKKHCFLCGSIESVVKINRDKIININISKILVQEDVEEYFVCPSCFSDCNTEVKEIIGFSGFGQALARELEYKK